MGTNHKRAPLGFSTELFFLPAIFIDAKWYNLNLILFEQTFFGHASVLRHRAAVEDPALLISVPEAFAHRFLSLPEQRSSVNS